MFQHDRKGAREHEHRIKLEHINFDYSHAALVPITKGKNEKVKNKSDPKYFYCPRGKTREDLQ